VPAREGCRLPLIIKFLPLPVDSINGNDLSLGSTGVTSAAAAELGSRGGKARSACAAGKRAAN